MSKPKASDRTVDLFSGKTKEEENNEAERIKQGLDNVEQSKAGPVTIESNADRYRASAFSGQEWTSLLFGHPKAQEHEYRVSVKDGYAYLEKTAATPATNGAYHYAGVMVPEGDLPRLATVIVAAARAYIAKKKNG